MEKQSNYLDITDDDKSVAVSDSEISSSFYSNSEISNKKKHKRKRSRSRSRSRKHNKDKKKKHKKEKKDKEKKYKDDKKELRNLMSESPKRNKWSTIETNEKEPQIVKVPVKYHKKDKKTLEVIVPNENIKIEEKEKPNFNPKETILAKDTNTIK